MAAMPFELQVATDDGHLIHRGFYATQQDGQFAAPDDLLARLPDKNLVVRVRSLLTGGEQTARAPGIRE
jgi:hypothetical protein